ncbi:hypothetical protein AN639_09430 [Candidatus Epulonipiscium fishelsonii]|uniref:Uncharacterized protein n=1 Tax=Candidatus Epulonipiscium fishelsonii TaxID=77094 RepID=A0ACC8XDX7_9FIRM|nr:hypothetical protein AN639_09430 [Epulopiscium sp. SCG-B05WGA-EpuloA1]ONI41058.1 hypothetical protein AN396_04715 [Epulopiscium sp. SCG-B11WGA-EpuloA1]ONI47936.1 hypothetical protein AN644_03335 [Epulopiscium sp. SCG-C06WGA-EpuloA1]
MLDGIVLSNIINELKQTLLGGRIDKIYQTEKEELLMIIRNNRTKHKLVLNAHSYYPRLNLSTLAENTSESPPMFCMLLRKHLIGGKIINIFQPDFERIVEIDIEAVNELGDRENKKLILEIMGRHSNLIFINEYNTIIDSIKHISYDKSSLRPILPNYKYAYPSNQNKLNPLSTSKEEFIVQIKTKDLPFFKCIYTSYTGISPIIAQEMCLRANFKEDKIGSNATLAEIEQLFNVFNDIISDVKNATYNPVLYTDDEELPIEFYSFPLELYQNLNQQSYISISELVELYIYKRNQRFTVAQKTSDIRKLVQNFIDRAKRKQALQQKAIEDTETNELYKIYGELLTSYSYSIAKNADSFTTQNYYVEPYEDITIPLNPKKTAIENAQAYFKIYNKAKRTFVAATEQLKVIAEDLDYLNSVLISLDMLETETDILELRQELIQMGYLKKKAKHPKKLPRNSNPYMKYKTSSNLEIYIGKNNFQNDSLTMKYAKPTDMWFHIKDAPGSHVIVRIPSQYELTNQDLLECASLAAYFSSSKNSSNVSIDYTLKKHIKKIPNAKPGMVIYTHFKTLVVTPNEKLVTSLEA